MKGEETEFDQNERGSVAFLCACHDVAALAMITHLVIRQRLDCDVSLSARAEEKKKGQHDERRRGEN